MQRRAHLHTPAYTVKQQNVVSFQNPYTPEYCIHSGISSQDPERVQFLWSYGLVPLLWSYGLVPPRLAKRRGRASVVVGVGVAARVHKRHCGIRCTL